MDFVRRLFGMGICKPFKIQDGLGIKRIGITASSLKDLTKKASQKLKLSEVSGVVLEDGTEIDDDDYFRSLPANSVIVILGPNQSWDGCK